MHKQRQGVFHQILHSQRKDSISAKFELKKSLRNSRYYLERMTLWTYSDTQSGRINSLSWSTDGQLILSASKGKHLSIMNPFTGAINQFRSMKSNVLCARFLPLATNSQVVASTDDGSVMYYDLNASTEEGRSPTIFNCHEQCYIHQVLVIPSLPHVFFSGSLDSTVRIFDVRHKPHCHHAHDMDNIIIKMPEGITAMSLGSVSQNYIAVGGEAGCVRIYDLRNTKLRRSLTVPVTELNVPPENKSPPDTVTSLAYDQYEKYLLTNYFNSDVYLFDVEKTNDSNAHCNKHMEQIEVEAAVIAANRLEQESDSSDSSEGYEEAITTKPCLGEQNNPNPSVYIEHQYRCTIPDTYFRDVVFWGDNHILGGSNNTTVHIWDRHTTEHIALLQDVTSPIKCVAPHPSDPILATAGTDSVVRFWMPLAEKSYAENLQCGEEP
uniref:Uncharacterized protein n=1 Tax=Anopheles culicifacies TaxID=139723 RepID=A0A182LY26_9DIPT